ncbi:MAG: hypothetical protein ACPG7F_12340, partial [Aggregatilineales bacterium]
GIVGAGLFLLYMLPIINDTLSTDTYTGTTGFVRYSSDLTGLISPSFLHPVFDAVLEYPRETLGVNLAEGATYIGILAVLLSGIALVQYRAARWWLLLAGIAWILSLGPILKIFDQPVQVTIDGYQSYIALPLAPFQELPGLNLARTPGRYSFTVALAIAMLAGYGTKWLWLRLTAGRNVSIGHYVVVGVLIAGILFEYQTYFPMPTIRADIPEDIYELRNRDDIRAVFNVPWQHLLGAKESMYLQTAHEKPLLAGQVSRVTPVNPAKLNILQETLHPALLQEAGADIVIFHKQRAREINLFETLQNQFAAQGFGQPIYEDDKIAVYETPINTTPAQSILSVEDTAMVEDTIAFDFYSVSPEWVDFQAIFAADGRDVQLWLDDRLVAQETIIDDRPIGLALPMMQPGYHQVRITLDPPCPIHHDETLQCRTLNLSNIHFSQSESLVVRRDMTYENGAYLISDDVQYTNNTLTVRLWWRFDETIPDTDIRFVHILNAFGENVAQSDISPGEASEGEIWSDMVILSLIELPPGDYSVRLGWYDTLSNFTRYPVSNANLPGIQDASPEIARFTIE